MTRACDVLVLGAGPAGAATALHLARAGFDVVLADQKAFPRDKPCGEFLGPACRPYLAELGVDAALLAAGTRLVHGMRLHGEGRRAAGRFAALRGAPHAEAGYAVRREVLDLHLLQAARARPEVRWLERHTFRMLQRDARGQVTGAVLRDADRRDVPVAARFVVGADGVRSHAARQLGWQRRTAWLDRMALIGASAASRPTRSPRSTSSAWTSPVRRERATSIRSQTASEWLIPWRSGSAAFSDSTSTCSSS
jgi:2-polyprenyl-6-methoxyphenol hydroxylase-like FAD-dependent oxidoreductase